MTVAIESPTIIEVSVEPAPVVEVEVESTGGTVIELLTNGQAAISQQYQTGLGLLLSSPAIHKEFSYISGNISQIDIWSDPSKIQKLFTKTFAYLDGNLVSIAITNELAEITLTKTLSYANGDLISITDVFS